jgi:hypothetical protein
VARQFFSVLFGTRSPTCVSMPDPSSQRQVLYLVIITATSSCSRYADYYWKTSSAENSIVAPWSCEARGNARRALYSPSPSAQTGGSIHCKSNHIMPSRAGPGPQLCDQKQLLLPTNSIGKSGMATGRQTGYVTVASRLREKPTVLRRFSGLVMAGQLPAQRARTLGALGG